MQEKKFKKWYIYNEEKSELTMIFSNYKEATVRFLYQRQNCRK